MNSFVELTAGTAFALLSSVAWRMSILLQNLLFYGTVDKRNFVLKISFSHRAIQFFFYTNNSFRAFSLLLTCLHSYEINAKKESSN